MKAIERERKRRKGKIIYLTKQEGYYWKKAIQIKDSWWNYLVLRLVWWKKIQQMTGYKSMTSEKVRNSINLCWFEIDMKSWMIIYKGRLNKVDRWRSDKKSCYKTQITNPYQIQISASDTCLCKKLKNDINLCWFEIDKKSWLFNYKGCLDKPDRWWSDKKEKWIGSKNKDFFPFLF